MQLQASFNPTPDTFQQLLSVVGLLLLGMPPLLSRVWVPVSNLPMPVSTQTRQLKITERGQIHGTR